MSYTGAPNFSVIVGVNQDISSIFKESASLQNLWYPYRIYKHPNVTITAIYLQFATFHKCFDTILISSAPPACGFWSLSHIFHKYREITHYLSPIFPLFLLNYSMPLPVAR